MSRLPLPSRHAARTGFFTRGKALSCCFLAGAAALAGCASQGSGGGVLDKALEAVGLSKPAPPELSADSIKLPAQPKKVTLRLHAAETLNTDANGKALSVVARVYKLRSATTFMQAPYDAFKDSASERQALGNDIIESREVVLTPGKKYEVVETLPNETAQIAVVALFRTPDPQRWKFVFDAKDAVKTGVTLGLHACAMSVAGGEPLGASLEVRRLAGMHCPES
jgi:type VI secretion system protein VasD